MTQEPPHEPPQEPPPRSSTPPPTPPPPPPYGAPEPFLAPGAPPSPAYPPYQPPPASDRVRIAWQRRQESDYVFAFWTALGWTLLTLGIYGFYVFYQLMRRSRDHNLRRIELLDAATTFAWDSAQARGLTDELRPSFERISAHMATLRQQATQFRDPAVWTVIAVLASTVVYIVGYVLLDGDLITHDHAEGAIEHELSAIYERLGAPFAPPDPSRLKGRHNYAGRIVATVLTCGIYALWWQYDIMTEGNRHFEQNWVWEDGLAASVQQLIGA